MTDYLLASDEEMARLQLQALVWEGEAEALLDIIDVQPGWACLDMGCGSMGILGPLSRRVGQAGRVVGIERDPRQLAAVHTYVNREQFTNVEVLEGNVLENHLPRTFFDFVHERYVLPYVSVDAMLSEMLSLTKPGGILAVQEVDQYSFNYFPENPAWPRLKAILESAFLLRGDLNIGRKCYGFLRDLGLRDVKIRAGVLALQDSHPYMRFPLVALGALRPHIVDAGIATEDELDSLIMTLEGMINDPQTYLMTFTTVQVWGQKPI